MTLLIEMPYAIIFSLFTPAICRSMPHFRHVVYKMLLMDYAIFDAATLFALMLLPLISAPLMLNMLPPPPLLSLRYDVAAADIDAITCYAIDWCRPCHMLRLRHFHADAAIDYYADIDIILAFSADYATSDDSHGCCQLICRQRLLPPFSPYAPPAACRAALLRCYLLIFFAWWRFRYARLFRCRRHVYAKMIWCHYCRCWCWCRRRCHYFRGHGAITLRDVLFRHIDVASAMLMPMPDIWYADAADLSARFDFLPPPMSRHFFHCRRLHSTYARHIIDITPLFCWCRCGLMPPGCRAMLREPLPYIFAIERVAAPR